MANKYFINLPEKTTPEDSNILPIEDSQDTKRMTWANFVKPIKDMIGSLASLTTSHKSTLVGAINELQANSLSQDLYISNLWNTFAEELPSNTVRLVMTSSGDYPLPGGVTAFGVGIILKRWEQIYIIAMFSDGTTRTRYKSSSAAPWGSWTTI
jgi:hypothetical protein